MNCIQETPSSSYMALMLPRDTVLVMPMGLPMATMGSARLSASPSLNVSGVRSVGDIKPQMAMSLTSSATSTLVTMYS